MQMFIESLFFSYNSHLIKQGLNDLNSIFSLQITDVAYHFSETKVLIKASCDLSYWEPTLVNLNMTHEL